MTNSQKGAIVGKVLKVLFTVLFTVIAGRRLKNNTKKSGNSSM